MLVYRTPDGLARREGDELVVVDLPHDDISALLRVHGPMGSAQQVAAAAPTRRIALEQATLLAPVSSPTHLVIVGANYRDHVVEAGMSVPSQPLFFTLTDAAVAAPDAVIMLPDDAPDTVDYEGELAVIIGRAGAQIEAADAWAHVGGLTVANDVSARDVQLTGMENGRVVDPTAITRAKSFPGFKPLGSAVAMGEQLKGYLDLELCTRVNGFVRQSARPRDMIFDIPSLIEHVSRSVSLEVGDVILTGTPAGVGLASNAYLRAGDHVEVSLGGWRLLSNQVASADAPSHAARH